MYRTPKLKNMKKIKKFKVQCLLTLIVAGLSIQSCQTDDSFENKKNEASAKKLSYTEDGVAKVYTLGSFNGIASHYLENDEHFEVHVIDMQNLPTDINALYINTSDVSSAQIDLVKQSKLYRNFLNHDMKIIIDANSPADSLRIKDVCLAFDAGYINEICSSIIRLEDDGSIGNIPVWNHNQVSFSAKGFTAPNSLYMMKAYIYEAWAGEADDTNSESKNREMMSNLGLIPADNDSKNNIVSSTTKTIPEIKAMYNQLDGWDMTSIMGRPADEANNCIRKTNINNVVLNKKVVTSYSMTSCSPINQSSTLGVSSGETRQFAWNVAFSVGLKLVPEAAGKLFGMDLKEVGPQAGFGFSATFARTQTESFTGTVPARMCGQVRLMKDEANVSGQQYLKKMKFKYLHYGSDGNTSTRKYEADVCCQYQSMPETITLWADPNHPCYINNPWVHEPYLTINTWRSN